MKKIILIFILFAILPLFSQEIINPIKEITYGNNNHTNRDFLNYTLKDNSNNIYLLGSTENDFTFNDIKIIKLDKDLNVLWEKEKSFDIGISYDGVMGGHIDSDNNLFVICRAAYNSYDQIFIVLKYNQNGDLLWEYPLSDLSNPQNLWYYSFSSFIDESDNLHIKYKPVNQVTTEYFFLTLSPIGQKITEFSNSNLFTSDNGNDRRFKLLNNNGVYNMLSVEDISGDPYQKFILHKFTSSSEESYNLNLDNSLTSYFNSPFAETWTIMKKDNNNNLILVAPDYQFEKDYGILNINPDGTLKYSKLPNTTTDRYLLDFAFDNQNNLLIISNNKTSDTSDPLKITIQKYNQNGDLFFESSDSKKGIYATINDSKISILTENNQIVNYDFDLNLISQIQLNSTNNFSVNHILNIEENYYLSGQTEAVSYNGSVLVSEIDMLIKKTNNSNEINSFSFNGNGTSSVYISNELVVRDTAYAFAVTERVGPSNYSPSGSSAPNQQRFVTLNKDLNIIEDNIVGLNDILYTTYYPKNLTTPYQDNNGNNYEYKIKNDTTQVSLYKNNTLTWSRDLNLYIDPNPIDPTINDNELIYDWKVNKKGDFLLTTNIPNGQCTLHKYSLDNNYNNMTFNELQVAVVPMSNYWLFILNQFGYISIYSDRLSIINEINEPISSNSLYQETVFIKEHNNQIVFNKHNEEYIRIFNQFGEIQDTYFKVDLASLSASGFVEYDKNFLITLDFIGSSIYLSPEYSWSRAVIKKFDLDISYSFSSISYDDNDNDGVANNIDECRNTQSNEEVNQYGCSQTQLSISEQKLLSSNINIYPNPSNGIIYYKSDYNIKSIEIFDELGRKISAIKNLKLNNNQGINLIHKKKGIYFLKFYFNNKQTQFKKIIIK